MPSVQDARYAWYIYLQHSNIQRFWLLFPRHVNFAAVGQIVKGGLIVLSIILSNESLPQLTLRSRRHFRPVAVR